MLRLRLGILFSTSGDHGALGRDCWDGAVTALADINAGGLLGLLPWAPAEKPASVVALPASEAPGCIAWALEQTAAAGLARPRRRVG